MLPSCWTHDRSVGRRFDRQETWKLSEPTPVQIPEAREVHISRKDRKVLEARCRSPATLQRDLKRARIVLLAAAGRSTRSIAKEVGVQPRIVSLWRHRYADRGREGLQDRPRPGKQPIYTKATDKRILKLFVNRRGAGRRSAS
jgi:hypothetical protein